MKRDQTSGKTTPLVYRERSYPLIGIPLTILGLFMISGTGAELFQRWPADFGALLGGVMISLFVLGIGGRLLVSREVVLDRLARQVITSSNFLGWGRLYTQQLIGVTSVCWQPYRGNKGVTYRIRLLGPEVEMYLFDKFPHTEARRATSEIGEFLDLTQDHWDKTLLTPDLRNSEMPDVAALQQLGHLVGRQSMRCVFRSESKLVFTQTFEIFLKVFGCVAGPLGLLIMLSPLLGKTMRGMEEDFWTPLLIGAIFVVLAVVFLLGRRGITIDTKESSVSTWWGVPIPFWSSRYCLSTFSSLGCEPYLEDRTGHPHVANRVFLNADTDEKIILYKSPSQAECKMLADQIGDFLNIPVVSNC